MTEVKNPKSGQVNKMNQVQAQPPGQRRDPSAAKGGVSPEFQAHIGLQLRAVYETMIAEPVPDRFLKLLEELDHRKAEEP